MSYIVHIMILLAEEKDLKKSMKSDLRAVAILLDDNTRQEQKTDLRDELQAAFKGWAEEATEDMGKRIADELEGVKAMTETAIEMRDEVRDELKGTNTLLGELRTTLEKNLLERSSRAR